MMDNNLPVTRKALFKDILRNRWRTLISIGGMLLLFALPFIASSFFRDYFLINLFADNTYFDGTNFTEEGKGLYQSIELIYTLINMLSTFIFMIGVSGIIRIFRKLCWSEGVLFFLDFKEGIKQNILSNLAYSIIFSMIYFLFRFSLYSLDNILFAFIVLIIGVAIFIPLIITGICYSSIYKAKIGRQLFNSFTLYIKNFPYILLLSLLFVLPFLVELMPYELVIIKQIVTGLVIFIYVPLFMLFSYLMNLYIFDKDINSISHKEIYRKGLY